MSERRGRRETPEDEVWRRPGAAESDPAPMRRPADTGPAGALSAGASDGGQATRPTAEPASAPVAAPFPAARQPVGTPVPAGGPSTPPVGGHAGTSVPSPVAPAPAVGRGTTVEVTRVSRWFGPVVAVSDVSFALGPGITGLLGPNGAGKTTLLRMLAGVLTPSRGEIRLLGQAVRGNPAVYRHLTLIMDRDAIYPMLTGREFVRLNAHLQGIRDESRVERALATVELLPVAERRMGGYSKGMRQRARLAAGLVHDPEVLLLDEPFSGADPRQRMHLMELLRRLAAEGRTILFSSHILEEVEQLAHKVLVITHGKLAAAGDVGAIRRAMLDRPHRVRVRAGDPRALAAVLVRDPVVTGLELHDDGYLVVEARELGACALALPRAARSAGIRLFEVVPEDESLERVFAYLVGGRG